MLNWLKKLLSAFNVFEATGKRFKQIKGWLTPKRLRRLVVLIVVTLGIALIVFWRRSQRQPAVELATAEERDIYETVMASGEVKAETEVSLKFQTSGQLAWVGVKEGDKVKKWQALASLDKRALEKQLQQELIDFQKEYRDLDQSRDDYDSSSISDEIKRILNDHQDDLNRSVLDVEINQLTLKYATLISPISGIVTQVDIPVAGVNITPATASFVIADPSSLVFQANVDETEVGKTKVGQEIKLILDAYPDEEIELNLDQIGFTSTVTSGGGTAFPIKVKLPVEQEEKYRLGMNGDLEIIIAARQGVLTIPFEAVRDNGDGSYVWLKTANEFVKQPVETGFSNDFYTQILTGINPGDQVVVAGFKELNDGFSFGSD